ncbi:MAG: hypothetical protein LBD97_07645 [Bifidobacteriaceae bacterium]|nr:hypothetical protein [Bifidobacteriaceae bacterium]
MNRRDTDYLKAALNAIDAIVVYTRAGLERGVVFDAVCMRLIQIGEAVHGLSPAALARAPETPPRAIVGVRYLLADADYEALFDEVRTVVGRDLTPLGSALQKILAEIDPDPTSPDLGGCD